MYIYIYIYIYIHTYIHYPYTRTYVYIHTCTYTYMHTCIHTAEAAEEDAVPTWSGLKSIDKARAEEPVPQDPYAVCSISLMPLCDGRTFLVCMYVCVVMLHVRMYVCTYVCMCCQYTFDAPMRWTTTSGMYVRMYVCTYVCMYVCMYVLSCCFPERVNV